MQRNKNLRLFIIFVFLLVVNLGFIYFEKTDSLSTGIDPHQFTLKDTTGVDQITLQSSDHKVVLRNSNGKWLVNGKYVMNQQMTGLIFAVLTSVESKRPVTKLGEIDLSEYLKTNGTAVKIYRGENVIQSFFTGGNPTKTTSFMMKEEVPYVVNIPGYTSYVAGLFALTEGDWRDRSVFKTSSSTLNAIKIVNTLENERPSLDIRFTGNFFSIEGISKLDTLVLVDYLEKITSLEVDRYVSRGELVDYDSLQGTMPEYTVYLGDVNKKEEVALKIFPLLPGDRQRLVEISPEGELALIRNSKIDALLKTKLAFQEGSKPGDI